MMIKTAVTLSSETLARLAYLGGTKGQRSRVIEQAVAKMARDKELAEQQERELRLLNQIADEECEDTLDVLKFSVDPFAQPG